MDTFESNLHRESIVHRFEQWQKEFMDEVYKYFLERNGPRLVIALEVWEDRFLNFLQSELPRLAESYKIQADDIIPIQSYGDPLEGFRVYRSEPIRAFLKMCINEAKKGRFDDYLALKEEMVEGNKLSSAIKRGDGAHVIVLFLTADPTTESRLRLGEEQREIQEKIRLAKYRDRFGFEARTSVRPQDISQALLDVKPHIVHFAGHGDSSGALCFEDKMGQSQLVEPDVLSDLFGQFKDQVGCVILSACFSEKQAKSIAKHVNYVIGMNNAISDPAAIAFAIGFYQALGAGESVEKAFALGTIQIRLQGIREQTMPVLITRDSEVIDSTHIENKNNRKQMNFVPDTRINELITNVGIGDWESAFMPAIEILKNTNEHGENELFQHLLDYQDYEGEDDSLWSAIEVIETCAQLSPSLINHEILGRMARNENFTVRSMAASICMDLAQSAPDRVPVDLLLKLSRYDENWYVQAPANAALKALASSQPVVLYIYFQRLRSDEQGERAHSAYALASIAKKEPELFDLEKLEKVFEELVRCGDEESLAHIKTAIEHVKGVEKRSGYKYGL